MKYIPTPQQHEMDALVIKRFTQDGPFDFYWKDDRTNFFSINMGCVPLLTKILQACRNRRQRFPVQDFAAIFVGKFPQNSATFSNLHHVHESLSDKVKPAVEIVRGHLINDWKGLTDYETEFLPLITDLCKAMDEQGQKAHQTGRTYYPDVTTSTSTSVFSLHALQRQPASTPASGSAGGGGTKMTFFPAAIQPQGSIVANTTLHFSTSSSDGTPVNAGILPIETTDSTSGGANAPPSPSNGGVNVPPSSSNGDTNVSPLSSQGGATAPPSPSLGGAVAPPSSPSNAVDILAEITRQTDEITRQNDEITRRLQLTVDYQHALFTSFAAHQAANDGSAFNAPAPPKL